MSDSLAIPDPPRPFSISEPLLLEAKWQVEPKSLKASFPETEPEAHDVSDLVTPIAPAPVISNTPLDQEYDLLMMRTGFYIHSQMARLGVRQEELAHKVGLEPQVIDNIILGRNSDLTIWELYQICKVFGISFVPNFADNKLPATNS